MERRIFFWVLLLLLVLPNLHLSTAQGESYIIVHAVNPEGVEIASIEGMDSYSVKIYNGDNLIGYGAYNEETHNQPIAILPGAHTIKAVFNGMNKEHDITISDGETKKLLFTFSRIEPNISWNIDESVNIEHSWSNEPGTSQYWIVVSGVQGYAVGALIQIFGGWQDRISGSVQASASAHLDTNYFSGSASVSGSVSVQGQCNVYVGAGEYRYPTDPYPPIDPYPVDIPSQEDFVVWYSQYVLDGIYPGVWLIWQGSGNVTLIKRSGLSSNPGGDPGYHLIKVPTIVDYKGIKLLLSYSFARDFWPEIDIGYGFPSSDSDSYSFEGELVDFRFSSVPYDILGTGIKCEVQPPPVASFTYSPDKPMVGGKIDFIARENQRIVEYKWDFGNGEWGSGPEVSHIFEEPRNYNVKLTVTDVDGQTDSNSVELDLHLKNGDLLVWRSEKSLVPGLWTHIGIYIEDLECVIEARGWPKVKLYPLSDWFYPLITYAAAIRVGADDDQNIQSIRNDAVNFAWDRIGQPYDWYSILTDQKQCIEEQWSFFSTCWYCSELVWAAYLNTSNGQINLDPDNQGAVSPTEIALSEHVEFRGWHLEDKPSTIALPMLWGRGYCPIDLEITDPDVLTLNKQGSQIPAGVYQEFDIDGDNELDDFFAIPEPKEGDYLIYVITEPDASTTDTFTLVVNRNGTDRVLAQDVQVQDIPEVPYVLTGLDSIGVDVKIEPETLNLSSKGNWITCYIYFPKVYYAHNVNRGTLLLNGQVGADWIGTDDEENQERILIVKFHRREVSEILQTGNVQITVSGELFDGTKFEGTDAIRVTDKGGQK